MKNQNSRKFEKSGRVAATDQNYTGVEPEWSENMTKKECATLFSKALNFYNYYLNRDDYIPIIQEYMVRNHYDAKDVAAYKHIPKTIGSIVTTGKIARMYNRGMPNWNEDYKEQLDNGISSTLSVCHEILRRKKSEPKETNTKPKPNVHEIMKEKVRTSVLCELEGMLDTWCTSNTKVVKFPIASVLRGENIPVSATGDVKEWLTKQRNEYNEAFEKTCDQMVEGYSYLSKPGLRNRIKALDDMLNELVLYKSSKAAARKPRVKKPQSAIKQVQRLKYLTEHKDYAIQSCDPTRIIGATKLFVFNVKYRRLTMFYSNGPNGFTVKGTTIKDFNEDLSYAITLRKPEDYLPIIAAKTEKQIEKALKELKTKRKSANGRINQETILIRAL